MAKSSNIDKEWLKKNDVTEDEAKQIIKNLLSNEKNATTRAILRLKDKDPKLADRLIWEACKSVIIKRNMNQQIEVHAHIISINRRSGKNDDETEYPISDVSVLFKPVDKEGKISDKTLFCKVTAWREAAQIPVDKLEEGKNYKLSVQVKYLENGDIDNLNITDTTKVETSDEKFPTPLEFFDEELGIIDIVDMGDNLSEIIEGDVNKNDWKQIEMTILYSNIKTSKKGFVYGQVTGFDNSVDVSGIKDNDRSSLVTTFMTPQEARENGAGSIVRILGSIEINVYEEKERIQINKELLIPIVSIPNTLTEETEVPDEAVDAEDEYKSEEKDYKKLSNCSEYGEGYDSKDDGCKECKYDKECQENK